MSEEFYIVLSINGDENEVDVTNPYDTINVLIDNIIHVFELPRVDGGGNPVTYFLGKTDESGEEIILHPERNKQEQNLVDYNVKSGDRLVLTMVPLAG